MPPAPATATAAAAVLHLEPFLPCLTTFSHYKQFHAQLITSARLYFEPSLRARFLDRLALSAHAAALPHALLLLRSLPSPATNDLNAALRGLAASPHPARSGSRPRIAHTHDRHGLFACPTRSTPLDPR